MSRGETETDREHQKEIADFILQRYASQYDGYIWLGAGMYRLDGCLFKKQPLGFPVPRLFFEAKWRNSKFGEFKQFTVSLGKLIAARQLTDATGCRCCLFARFSDGVIASMDFAKHRGAFVITGRRDRDREIFPNDIEPQAAFEWNDFAILHDPRPSEAVA
jgi:hypothetical protein